MQVGYQGYVVASNPAFIKACNEIGIPIVKDLNTGNGVGAKQGTATISNRYQRSSSYCFYDRAKGRPNLRVMHDSPAQRLVFNRQESNGKPRATGVVFMDNLAGKWHNVSAKKEVILALGAVQSPQLLMVSVCLAIRVVSLKLMVR